MIEHLYRCYLCNRKKVLLRPEVKPLFTEAEHRIVGMVFTTMANKAIANDLFIAENTVKFHLTNIYRKLNIVTRYQLIRLCGEHPKVLELGLTARQWREYRMDN